MKGKQTVYHQNKVEKIRIQTDYCNILIFKTQSYWHHCIDLNLQLKCVYSISQRRRTGEES